MGPLSVSVVIPVYNAAAYVRTAVESAVAEPEVGEVLLVEDGSADDSLAVCEALSREFDSVSLLGHSERRNRGPGASRNIGIQAARHELVAFLDADDYYLPGRFSRAVEIFVSNDDIDGVYEAVGTYFEDAAGRSRWTRDGREMLTTVRVDVPPERLLEAFRIDNSGRFCTDGIVVRKSLFAKTGMFDEHLKISQDTVMWLKMAAVGKLVGGRLADPVAMRRVHSNNRATKESMVRASRDASLTFYAWVCERCMGERIKALALDYQLESEWRQINLKNLRYAGRVCLKALVAIRLLARSPLNLGARVVALRVRNALRILGWSPRG